MRRFFSLLLMLAALMLLAGCHASRNTGLFGFMFKPKTLKVGMAVDTPPLAWKKNNQIIGLERQFAQGLAEAMHRQLELVELPRRELAPALSESKVDIVMAGMTVAEARQQKLATTTPYLISGQVVLVHLDDFQEFGRGTGNLRKKDVRLGVIADSSGDTLVKDLRPQGTITRFSSGAEGLRALITDKIDVFIQDFPANGYCAALFIDKGLTPGVSFLTREPLAWAVRPNDTAMRDAANAYLGALQQNGELEKMLDQAIPFYRNTAYSPKQE